MRISSRPTYLVKPEDFDELWDRLENVLRADRDAVSSDHLQFVSLTTLKDALKEASVIPK